MKALSEIKQEFYSKVKDVSIFDCDDINLFKVVLDGLKVDYVNRWNIRPYLFFPYPLYRGYMMLRDARKAKPSHAKLWSMIREKSGRKILISDVGRLVSDKTGQKKSLYFENVLNVLGRQNLVHVLDEGTALQLEVDVDAQSLRQAFLNGTNCLLHDGLRTNLRKTFLRIKRSGLFSDSDLRNIKVAFQNFFEQFVVWHSFLTLLPDTEICFFTCHYHKEGQIYALKKRNITCVELQHGLIAQQDLFYVFPNLIRSERKKMLFADKMLVFGEYWRKVLLRGAEHSADEIGVVGYYLFEEPNETEQASLRKQFEDKRVILVTTQTFLHEYFIAFVEQLEKHILQMNSNFVVVIKPHPSEELGVYETAFKKSNIVYVMQKSLPLLFNISFTHISVYSTSLFDALRYGLKNYVFKVDLCKEYVDDIIRAGVADEITDIEKWLHQIKEEKSEGNRSLEYYAGFNPQSLKDTLTIKTTSQ